MKDAIDGGYVAATIDHFLICEWIWSKSINGLLLPGGVLLPKGIAIKHVGRIGTLAIGRIQSDFNL